LFDLRTQKAVASGQLGGNREIARGQTLDRIGNPAIEQPQTVIDGAGLGAVAEAEAVQTTEQQLAGLVAGERPPAGIGAVEAGREPHYQQAGLGGPEGRHRSGVVAGEASPNAVQIIDQAWATAAIDIEGARLGHDGPPAGSDIVRQQALT
jgi:hypothetical protein